MRSQVTTIGMEGLVFRRATGGRVKIPHAVLAAMAAFTQTSEDAREAGGVLIGRFLRDSEDIVIDDLTTPFPKDRRTRVAFIRRDPRHQLELDRRWMETAGTCNYLGEWHTHPEGIPVLSIHDVSNMVRVLGETQFEGDSLLFVIVGSASVAMWEVSRRNAMIVPLPRLATRRGNSGVKPKDVLKER